MNSLIRLTGAVNRVNCAVPGDCLDEMKGMLDTLKDTPCDIVVFPKLSLCSPECGSLFHNTVLLEQCESALDELAAYSREMDCYILAGLPLEDLGRTVSAMALLYRGELVAYIPTVDNPPPFLNSGFSGKMVPADTVFACGRLRFCVLGCELNTLSLRAAQAAQNGCDLIVVPAYDPVYAGFAGKIRETAKAVSGALGCGVCVVNGGVGDTSSPHLYGGFAAIYECGSLLARQESGSESFFCTADLDVDIIRACKRVSASAAPCHSILPLETKPGLLRKIGRTPFLPDEDREGYLKELFDLQVRSLAARIQNIGATRLVVGVSGGLDSTAVLLCCAAVADVLGLPRKNIIGVTMPGMGTSDRTYFNALALLESLGVEMRDISIRRAVVQHLQDIGHSGQKDVVYENAQARERAQILFDVANDVGGIVVGTGDLSEAALGFCTFAGDHIANYNVNAGITKTVLRAMLNVLAGEERFAQSAETLRDILETPISPELLPGEDGEEQGHKTEEILGPYELHDFFLYYFIRYRFRPAKLYYYACMAFKETLEPDFVRDKLGLFLERFCAAQFKRACSPDSASLTGVDLGGYYIPSDLDPSALLKDLEEI